jgi:L-ascorbate metabolism protein UlaG (beta-lactamase superfamily)
MPRVDALLPLDAVVISHAHGDHLDLPSLRRVCRGSTVVVPAGCGRLVRRVPARDIVELEVGQRFRVGAVVLEALHAEHDGKRHPLARDIPALGYLISGGMSVYFAGDTDLFAGMSELAGRVDVACLPVAGWGPRLPPGHLDPWGAARAAALIRPRVAVPIHWGTMRRVGAQMAADPRAPARAFARFVERLGLPVDTKILLPGQGMPLGADRAGAPG